MREDGGMGERGGKFSDVRGMGGGEIFASCVLGLERREV